MRLQESPASQVNQRIPTISATPRSFLAVILSFACVLSLGIELPASAANPASAKDKKPAIFFNLVRAYAPRTLATGQRDFSFRA